LQFLKSLKITQLSVLALKKTTRLRKISSANSGDDEFRDTKGLLKYFFHNPSFADFHAADWHRFSALPVLAAEPHHGDFQNPAS
jgi:hypothetical protein